MYNWGERSEPPISQLGGLSIHSLDRTLFRLEWMCTPTRQTHAQTGTHVLAAIRMHHYVPLDHE